MSVIEAYDHFGTNEKDRDSLTVRFVGEYVRENDTYVFLRHFGGVDHESDDDEFHGVLKSSIITRIDHNFKGADHEIIRKKKVKI